MSGGAEGRPLRSHVGRFEVVRELGRGGMGVVFEVRDPALPGRPLALKLILTELADPDALARFAREAEGLGRVRHPGVVAVHAFDGTAPREPFLLTDLVPGRDLEDVVRTSGRLAPAGAAALVRDLACAVEAVHAAGVLHRDLKPTNVIVRPDGRPVIIDFGLARRLDATRLTGTGAIVGTPAFMAPEQASGAPLDARTDVYGLGAILYWLLAGHAPFPGPAVQALFALLHREPTWPSASDPTIPRSLEAICRRALAKDPAARPPTAAALRDELARWSSSSAATSTRRRWFVPALVALGSALGVALVATLPRPAPIASPPAPVPAPTLEPREPPAPPAPRPRVAEPPAPRDTRRAPTSIRPLGEGQVSVGFLDDHTIGARSENQESLEVFDLREGVPTRTPIAVDLGVNGGHGIVAAGDRFYVTTLHAVLSVEPRRGGAARQVCAGAQEPGASTSFLTRVAFDRDRRRAALFGFGMSPQLVTLDGSAPPVPLRSGGAIVGLTFVGDALILARTRAPDAVSAMRGELERLGPDGRPLEASLWFDQDPKCMGVDAEAGWIAIGFDFGRVELFRLAAAGLTRSQSTSISPLDAMAQDELNRRDTVRACAFGAGRLWIGTGSGLWAWPMGEQGLVGEAVRVVDLSSKDVEAGRPFGPAFTVAVSPGGALIAVGSANGGLLVRGVDARPE